MVRVRDTSNGTAIKITASTHARVVLACETLKISVADFMERSALASLQRQEEAQKIKGYELACSAAAAARTRQPAPEDYGLPRDFGIPSHP